MAAPTPPKRKRRIFLWFFLAVQAIFVIWIIAGIASNSGNATSCGTLDQSTCNSARDVGASIGVALVFGFWVVVDFILGVGYAIYRLARRP